LNTESLHFATSIEATMSKARMSDTAVQAMKLSHKEMAAYTYMISTGCRAGGAIRYSSHIRARARPEEEAPKG
jgi:hypothetical protein